LNPASLAMALPSVTINAFSGYAWMRSGGGHYSVAIVPFLVISAAYGADWVSRTIGRLVDARLALGSADAWRFVGLGIVSVGLVVALVNHYQNGISPLSRRFALEPISEHARRAQPFIEQVNDLPPDVSISVGSNLYPHVGHRQRVYLFPTISDAQFVLLDATGPPSPVGTGDQWQVVRDLMDYAQFGVAASDHGFLLLERGLDQYRLSPAFDEVFYAGDASPQVAVGTDFGGLLRLTGFDWAVRPVVRPELVVELTTYWRVLSSLEDEYHLVFYFWDEEGQLMRVQPEEMLVHWYPTWLWEPDRVIKVTLPVLPVGDLPHVGVAVLGPGVQDLDIDGRVVPITSANGLPVALWQQDTIVELIRP
jgi:hypothetical protein